MTDWQPIKDAPRDGTTIVGAELYRWVKYKPGAPKDLLRRGGRWQRFNGYGWENAEPPTHWMPLPETPCQHVSTRTSDSGARICNHCGAAQ